MIKKLFEFDKTYYVDAKIERLRAKLEKDHRIIELQDHGALSHKTQKPSRSVASIVKSASSSRLKCKLLRNIAFYFKPEMILEFGTNLGFSAAYLASANFGIPVYTIDGCPETCEIAMNNLDALQMPSVQIYNRLFDQFLKDSPLALTDCTFFYLDGNHKGDKTIEYVNWFVNLNNKRKVIVLDDIRWSKDMHAAWLKILDRKDCKSIDLYKLGIIIIDESFANSEHIKCLPRYFKPWQMGFFA